MTPNKALQLSSELNSLHEQCVKRASEFAQLALSIGRKLIEARQSLEHGEYGDFLAALNFSRTTAFRYLKLAENFDAKEEKLTDGKTVSDLYREFGLMTPLAGGGHRSETHKNTDPYTRQLEMCFAGFGAQLETFRSVPVTELSKVPPETLTTTRQQLAEALAMVDAALKPTVSIESEMALLVGEKESPGTGEPMTPINPETPLEA